MVIIASTGTVAAPGNGSVDVPAGTQPVMDGTISPGEWSDANTVGITVLESPGTVTVYFKFNGTRLYVAYTDTYWVETLFDLNNDGGSAPKTDDHLFHACGAVYEMTGNGTGWNSYDASRTGWNTAINTATELWFDFSKLGITAGSAKTMGIQFLTLDNTGFQEKFWPAASNKNNPGTWGNMASSMNWVYKNDPPEIAAPVSAIDMDEDTVSSSLDLNSVFSDPEGDDLVFSHDKQGASKENILVAITDGVVTLTPDDDWNGQETITFTAHDGVNPPVPAAVTVAVAQVNDAPVVVAGNLDLSFDEDTSALDQIILADVFYDIDTDVTLNAVPQSGLVYTVSTTENVVVTIQDGKVSFEAPENWNGEEAITLFADDGAAPKAAKGLTVTVNPVQDAPVVAAPMADIELPEDATGTESAAKAVDLRTVFTDADGDDLKFTAAGNTFIDITIDPLGVLSFSPRPDFNGAETITVTADDKKGHTVSDDLVVTITPVNDAPVIGYLDEDITLLEDSEFTYAFTATDVDGDALVFSLDIETQVPGLVLGENYGFDAAAGVLTITPDNSMVGEYTLTLLVDDSAGEDNSVAAQAFGITVKNVNDAPAAAITSPESGASFLTTDAIFLAGEVTDEDLDLPGSSEAVVSVWTSDLDGELGYGPSVKDVKLSTGVHKITLRSTDKAGLYSEAVITLNVATPMVDDDDDDETPIDPLDTDADGLLDSWEMERFGDLKQGPSDDADGDGKTNLEEYIAGTDPARAPASKSSGSGMLLPVIMAAAIVLVLLIGAAVVALLLVMKAKKKKNQEPPVEQPQQSGALIPEPRQQPAQQQYGYQQPVQNAYLQQQPQYDYPQQQNNGYGYYDNNNNNNNYNQPPY